MQALQSEHPRLALSGAQRDEAASGVHTGWAQECWRSRLSAESLGQLFRNEIAFIRLADFATRDECASLVDAALTVGGFSPYENVEPRINRIGNTVFEYDRVSRNLYFANNAAALRTREEIFSRSFDPLRRLMDQIREKTRHAVRIATRSDGAPYYAGLIRRIEDGTLLHIDFAPAEQKNWEVAQITSQLAWNLYLRTSGADDGRTHLYERQWKPADDAHREGSYGYQACVVEGARKTSFLPVVGEVVLFNTRNFHFVEKSTGDRITVTSALGILPDQEILFWS